MQKAIYVELVTSLDHYGTSSLALLDFDYFVFPGGEVHVKFKDFNLKVAHALAQPHVASGPHSIGFRINALVRNSNDLMAVALLKDALETSWSNASQRSTWPSPEIHLELPYVPYARQDRAEIQGEPFSLRVFANMLNSLKFDKVIIADPHSTVTPALIHNCLVIPQWTLAFSVLLPEIRDFEGRFHIVAPDAGAQKKAERFHKYAEKQLAGVKSELYVATKHRDPATGEIHNTTLPESFNQDAVQGSDVVLVLDDICDGGRTFLELADAIDRTGVKAEKWLYVTHGIFSKGREVLEQKYQKVLSMFDWTDFSNSTSKVK